MSMNEVQHIQRQASRVAGFGIGGNTFSPYVTPPQYTWTLSAATVNDSYANECEVVHVGQYDATLRFYRVTGNSRRLVKEVIVPIELLSSMTVPLSAVCNDKPKKKGTR